MANYCSLYIILGELLELCLSVDRHVEDIIVKFCQFWRISYFQISIDLSIIGKTIKEENDLLIYIHCKGILHMMILKNNIDHVCFYFQISEYR